ncbi:hypothetical protein P5673_018721 [Acropora cervicornis]|uniref:HECT domain-containing protein n=1 Tax=Acropora cervicornis TaxID=6130 RepID=A0AAD9QD15_ACRCE|nr:hypothetical protein P5673_018721 [Acropora cervicornis]
MQELGTGPTLAVTLHRAFLKNAILQLFKDPKIMHYNLDITIKSLSGREEEGKGVGVIREVLTIFWNECFSSLTVGAIEKVPCVRHDYKRSEWDWPCSCLWIFCGKESLAPDCLFESFKLFISEEDRQVVDKSLGKDFDPNDDDLLEFLSSFRCYKSPTLNNIKTLMNELAFQEIVQKPGYIVDCLSLVLAALRVFPPFEGEPFYIAKKPSPKKVIKLLSVYPQPGAEQNSFDYLKQYIKTLPSGELENPLQFLTGSNIITCENIDVTFTTLDGTTRRPVVHTCGPSLELPSTYHCYNELQEEFTALLHDKESWSFNIV